MNLMGFFTGFFMLVAYCGNAPAPESNTTATLVKAEVKDTLKKEPVRKSVSSLTQEEIRLRSISNPCYLPLIQSKNTWQPEFQKGFRYQDLINSDLPKGHPYANRYLVGDFNVVDHQGRNKGVSEIYPRLSDLPEFSALPPDLVDAIDTVRFGTPAFERVKADLIARMGEKAAAYVNFMDKVWKYRMVPIRRAYSILNDNIYCAGQSVVMCEACKDTLLVKGTFATSAKGHNSPSKNGHSGSFPIRKRRSYYAGLNIISSKNWERARKYELLDKKRDEETGGGNRRITHFKGKVELPNFLLIEPTESYPNAMHSNGIHEVALRSLARGMLGTANSLGCLRVSDFGSKFLRWWVPQNTRLFITYEDDKYHRRADTSVHLSDLLPFRDEQEGNAFRKWLNENKPLEAKILEIKETGDHKNGYILDGYYYFKEEYEAYRKQKITSKSQ